MLNFNHDSGLKITSPDFSDLVNQKIDEGVLARRAREPKRNYLGASLLGDPCTRRLVYTKMGVEPDEAFTARTLRIFDIGHGMEDFVGEQFGLGEEQVFKDAAARWFRDAGFQLLTKDKAGKQFGWDALGGQIQGHIDGVLVDGPRIDGLGYAALWETKALNKKNWSKMKKHGVKIGSELYHGQVQLNMGYLSVFQTVFTCVNKDSQEVSHELVGFDPAVAQRLSDRALEIVTMASKGELPPRIATQPDFYICRMCSRKQRCWMVDA